IEKKLPLRDGTAYQVAVRELVIFKERADNNSSHALATKIREVALQPFLLLREDPASYDTRQPSIVLKEKSLGSSNHARKTVAGTDTRRGNPNMPAATPQRYLARGQQRSTAQSTNRASLTTGVNKTRPRRSQASNNGLDAVNGGSPVDLLLRAANTTSPQNGHNPASTIRRFQNVPSEPVANNAMETEHEIGRGMSSLRLRDRSYN
ncbi:MAG: hypothetical protein Q9164_007158, partial [Protoblastenia rupestris]